MPTEEINRFLDTCLNHDASDLHLSANLPPLMRVHGNITRINDSAIPPEKLTGLLQACMDEHQRTAFDHEMDIDFTYVLTGKARFRVNAFQHERGPGAVFRVIPNKVPTLEELGAPSCLAQISLLPRGLVLVTGPTGSGKTTTLAAMVNHMNIHKSGHIITIEDPIEFVHPPRQCLINQRQIGTHSKSFSTALRAALREDPDALLIGEMRDLETIRLALTAAETGHLVFATLHTSSATKTIDRIIDVFPGSEQGMVRAMLSESLQAVISQTLCTAMGKNRRVAAYEIMLANTAIRNLIRESKVAQMYSVIQTSNHIGMQTLDQSLVHLMRQQVISPEEARTQARNPENVRY